MRTALATLCLRSVMVAMFGIASLSPTVAAAQGVPSYAQPNSEQTIHGRIRSIESAFHISVIDEGGYIDSVQLHHGTVINPTGLTLAPGMSVTIIGYNAGSVFQANEIDTPYQYVGLPPVPVYYGPGWWYPGFAYGWGPSYSLLIGIGGGPPVVRRPFVGRPITSPVPEPHPYVGHPYVGRSPGLIDGSRK
jgi:hypothetical protein